MNKLVPHWVLITIVLVLILISGGAVALQFSSHEVGIFHRAFEIFNNPQNILLLKFHKGLADSLACFLLFLIAGELIKRKIPFLEVAFLMIVLLIYIVSLKAQWFSLAYWLPLEKASHPEIGPFPYRVSLFRAGVRHYIVYPLLLVYILKRAVHKKAKK